MGKTLVDCVTALGQEGVRVGTGGGSLFPPGLHRGLAFLIWGTSGISDVKSDLHVIVF